MPHVQEIVKRARIPTIWMQEGIRNQQAYDLSVSVEIQVVMNFCLMKNHKKQAAKFFFASFMSTPMRQYVSNILFFFSFLIRVIKTAYERVLTLFSRPDELSNLTIH